MPMAWYGTLACLDTNLNLYVYTVGTDGMSLLARAARVCCARLCRLTQQSLLNFRIRDYDNSIHQRLSSYFSLNSCFIEKLTFGKLEQTDS